MIVGGLYTTAALILVVLLVYRYRDSWMGAFNRFDAANIARRAQEHRDKSDPLAHFKHTLRMAGEQIEEIQEVVESDTRTGDPVTRFIFAGEKFATRVEAEEARNQEVVAKARAFYSALPQALAERRGGEKLN